MHRIFHRLTWLAILSLFALTNAAFGLAFFIFLGSVLILLFYRTQIPLLGQKLFGSHA